MASYSEMTEEGRVVGQWFSSSKGSLGIVAQDGVAPYICFYPDKPKSGVLPHAVFRDPDDGDLKIQIPTGDNNQRRVLSLKKILDHLSDACECESEVKADATEPE